MHTYVGTGMGMTGSHGSSHGNYTNSDPDAWNAMDVINESVNYMGYAFLIFVLIASVMFTVMMFFKAWQLKVQKERNSSENIYQMGAFAILGLLLIIFDVVLFCKKIINDSDAESTSASDPTPDPTPVPQPDPAPAPESHDTSFINIDSTAAIIIAITVAVVLLVIIVARLHNKYAQRKAERQKQKDYRAMVRHDFNYAKKRITALSAAYAQAHIDPEYVLYKPLVISDNALALEFSGALMEARQILEECKELIDSDTSADIDYVGKAKLRKRAVLLDQQWDRLNHEAEKVGTPLLDSGQLRRAESLWTLATNESATVHERQHAMTKLQNIIAECQDDLASYTPPKVTVTKKAKDNAAKKQEQINYQKELLAAMSSIIDNGSKHGIIAAPHRFDELMSTSTRPALTV